MVLFNDTYYGDIFAEAYMAVESTLRQGPWCAHGAKLCLLGCETLIAQSRRGRPPPPGM